jgi:hypothetical protein
MENAGSVRAGLAGWLACAVALALGLAGAASSPAGLVLGVPSAIELAGAATAVASIAWIAGWRAGSPGLGLVPLLAVLLVGLRIPGLGAWTGGPLIVLPMAIAIIALARAQPAWARRAFIPVLLVVHLAAAARAQMQVGAEGDEPHYLMVAASLLEDGDLALEQDYASGRYRAFHPADLEPHYRVRGKGGAIYSLHAIGLSLLILPAYAAGGYPAVSFFMALLGVATAWQVRALVRDVVGERVADGVGWLVGLGPPLVHYAGLVFTEVPAALGVTIALRVALGASTAARVWGAGVLLAALPWLNVRYAILAAIVVAAALARRPALRLAVAWLAPSLVSAVALAAYHQALYGFFDPRRVYGRSPEFSPAIIPTGLPGLLFDQEFGLLVYAPILALALPGLVRLARTRRLEAATAAGLILAVVCVASAWPMWRGGFNPPARFLLPVVPALALGAACWLKRGMTFPIALLAAWTVWTGLVGAMDRPLVHRDRDVTAPLFRAQSGAVEWTGLLPGFVLDESIPDRLPLALVWVAALAAAAASRRRPTAARVAIGCVGLLAATATAAIISSGRAEGREAVHLLDRSGFRVPAGPVLRGQAAWTIADTGWGPLYEPHRHPGGAAIGSRLALPAGEYAIEFAGERVPSGLPLPVLEIAGAEGVSRVPLTETGGGMAGVFRRPGGGPATLALRDGGPFILKEIRLTRATFPAGSGPTR